MHISAKEVVTAAAQPDETFSRKAFTHFLRRKTASGCTQHSAREAASENKMEDTSTLKSKMPLLNRYVQSLCGLYSRIARQLNVDRSYVSRVARGERHSEEIERAPSSEFTRITEEQAPQQNG